MPQAMEVSTDHLLPFERLTMSTLSRYIALPSKPRSFHYDCREDALLIGRLLFQTEATTHTGNKLGCWPFLCGRADPVSSLEATSPRNF